MPLKKYSITMSTDADAAIADRSGTYGRSATISLLIERYTEIARSHRPTMRREDWVACCNALKIYVCGNTPRDASWLANDVYHAIERGSKYNKTLLSHAKKWDYAESLAVLDVAERYWSASDHDRYEILDVIEQDNQLSHPS